MPRKRKSTISGSPAQAPQPPVDATYGDGEAAIESQRRMPLPQASGSGGMGGAPAPAISPGPSSTNVPNDPKARLDMAMAALQRMQPPTGLSAPTQRPNEPFTTGLSMGAGPGPEVLRPGDRVARTLRTIADMTDNTRLRALADKASMRGPA